MAILTDAGKRMLCAFLTREREGRLREYVRLNGERFKAMPLRRGDGAQKAAAHKLMGDGFGEMQWSSFNDARFFRINDAGRAAIAEVCQ